MLKVNSSFFIVNILDDLEWHWLMAAKISYLCEKYSPPGKFCEGKLDDDGLFSI